MTFPKNDQKLIRPLYFSSCFVLRNNPAERETRETRIIKRFGAHLARSFAVIHYAVTLCRETRENTGCAEKPRCEDDSAFRDKSKSVHQAANTWEHAVGVLPVLFSPPLFGVVWIHSPVTFSKISPPLLSNYLVSSFSNSFIYTDRYCTWKVASVLFVLFVSSWIVCSLLLRR